MITFKTGKLQGINFSMLDGEIFHYESGIFLGKIKPDSRSILAAMKKKGLTVDKLHVVTCAKRNKAFDFVNSDDFKELCKFKRKRIKNKTCLTLLRWLKQSPVKMYVFYMDSDNLKELVLSKPQFFVPSVMGYTERLLANYYLLNR